MPGVVEKQVSGFQIKGNMWNPPGTVFDMQSQNMPKKQTRGTDDPYHPTTCVSLPFWVIFRTPRGDASGQVGHRHAATAALFRKH